MQERDYEELQLLAEEQAETICDLEKENYKLKTAMDNIERKIDFEKQGTEFNLGVKFDLPKTNFWAARMIFKLSKQEKQTSGFKMVKFN